ncbi:MAG: glycosyltransferase [Bacteroidales bacterium]|nr:glycosyltransferase [Bacteroidales bacterium]
MKPLLVNTFDVGGAAKACIRLHSGLLNSNIDSNLLVNHLTQKHKEKLVQIEDFTINNIKYSLGQMISNKSKAILKEFYLYSKEKAIVADAFIKNRDNRLEFYSSPKTNIDITKSRHYKESDIVNFHWVARMLDYSSFFKLNNKPIVWTLHDQNPFSGGEHYLEALFGIDDRGYPIKRVLTKIEKERFKENLDIKIKALKDVNTLTIVSPSAWLAKEAKQSQLFSRFPIEVIPNGIDTEVFKIRNQEYTKELFNIPLNKKVILFVADDVKNFRKGFEYLNRALKSINSSDFIFITVGNNNSDFNSEKDVLALGRINNDLLMSIIYSMADVFITPSIMDNLPNTIVESLCCGTPVIGFPVGGIPDMIEDEVNGIICKEISVKSLVEGIDRFFNNQERFSSVNISNRARSLYSVEKQTNAYIKIYQNMLK